MDNLLFSHSPSTSLSKETVPHRRLLMLIFTVLLAVAALRFFLIIWQFNAHHLLVPPSPDLVPHALFIDQILGGEFIWSVYPPLFHLLIALVVTLTGNSPLTILLAIAPYWFLLILPPFFLLALRLIGWHGAFWATLIAILVSLSPFTNFVDAQYPNILGYNIFGVLSLGFFIVGVESRRRRDIWIGFALLIATGLTHHLSFALMYSLIGLSALVTFRLATDWDQKQQLRLILRLLVGLGVTLLVVLSGYGNGIIPATLTALFKMQPLITDPTGTVLSYANLDQVPALLLALGLIGSLIILKEIIQTTERRFGLIVLLLWVITLWLLSRTPFAVLPQRIFRELNIPLAITAGLAVATTLDWFRVRWQKILIGGLWAYLFLINTYQLFVPPLLLPDGFKQLTWFHAVDRDKETYLLAKLQPTNLLIANSSNPILTYSLRREGRQVMEVVTRTAGPPTNPDTFGLTSADYIFIGILPPGVDPDTYFTSFIDYKATTRYLGQYVEGFGWPLIKQFDDGSKLYQNPARGFGTTP